MHIQVCACMCTHSRTHTHRCTPIHTQTHMHLHTHIQYRVPTETFFAKGLCTKTSITHTRARARAHTHILTRKPSTHVSRVSCILTTSSQVLKRRRPQHYGRFLIDADNYSTPCECHLGFDQVLLAMSSWLLGFDQVLCVRTTFHHYPNTTNGRIWEIYAAVFSSCPQLRVSSPQYLNQPSKKNESLYLTRPGSFLRALWSRFLRALWSRFLRVLWSGIADESSVSVQHLLVDTSIVKSLEHAMAPPACTGALLVSPLQTLIFRVNLWRHSLEAPLCLQL